MYTLFDFERFFKVVFTEAIKMMANMKEGISYPYSYISTFTIK